MIDAAKVSKALKTQLEEDAALINAWPGIIIERSEYVNESLHRTPWIGVFRSRKEYLPRTLGKHASSWRGQAIVRVMVQYASIKSGEDAEDQLEKLLESVESAIVNDLTIGGTMEMVTSLNVDYLYVTPDDVHNVYFQQAVIELTGEVSTG